MIRLAAFDLDGTLFNSSSRISDVNLAALDEARKRGIRIVIASGRPYTVVRHVLEQLCLDLTDSYCITLNGAQIIRCRDDKELSGSFISGRDVRDIAGFVLPRGAFMHTYSVRRGLLLSRMNPYSEIELFGGLVKHAEDNFLKLDDNEKFYKALVAAQRELVDQIAAAVPDELRSRFKVIRSLGTLLEFLEPGTGKGPALARLAEELGISAGEIIAFGDEQNDLDMIEYAGTGVAMANGGEEIKRNADFVTLSNDEDGVAYALRRFCF